MILTPPNETKSAKIKKITKFSQNDKKKKNALCYNTPNTFQCKCVLMQMHSNV